MKLTTLSIYIFAISSLKFCLWITVALRAFASSSPWSLTCFGRGQVCTREFTSLASPRFFLSFCVFRRYEVAIKQLYFVCMQEIILVWSNFWKICSSFLNSFCAFLGVSLFRFIFTVLRLNLRYTIHKYYIWFLLCVQCTYFV